MQVKTRQRNNEAKYSQSKNCVYMQKGYSQVVISIQDKNRVDEHENLSIFFSLGRNPNIHL